MNAAKNEAQTGRLLHLFGHLLAGKFTVKAVDVLDMGRVRVRIVPPTQKHPRDVMERLLGNNANVNYWLIEYCDSNYELGTYFVFKEKKI